MDTVRIDISGIYPEVAFNPGAVLDLSGLEGTVCYCSDEAAASIRRAIASYPSRGIHWIDGGDFHYISLFWLEKLSEPFTLMLIDHHPDDQDGAFGGGILSCGSWVAAARRLPLCRAVHWLGHDAVAPEDGTPVYLSIDLDVLRPEDMRTNWDQGTMPLDALLGALGRIAAAHRILGVDVCGGITRANGGVDKDFTTNLRTYQLIQDYLLNLPLEL